MTHALRIGRTAISYELRRSATASERRITVTPGHVEVLALTTDDDDAIAGFLDRKRQWLLDTVREMERIAATRHAVPRFMTGSKIPYRGRNMPLTVRRSDAERIEIAYRNGFIVDLPVWAGRETDRLVASELKLWLKQRARRNVKEIAAIYASRFGLQPRSIRVADFATGWGSCGPEGNILINWHLIFAPRKVLEYVVLHELAHLRHRSHGPEFWNLLSIASPDWSASKQWLDRHQHEIVADFLDWKG
ncbi:M48 family metallopeptidase [Sphingomonas canadensis]|uniref:M48 family metallopeptidase n=1 Tax=Sphingomonas canadensis TaxID=1219257 RepID=A0ABW3HAS6_9SPHN|nr:SprT family zinc-dependent metalloprotease [Sphingomonas canadensis]MCW3837077.1 M48 family metallopeptidase [Sphingomonas canadensis]